MNNRALKPKTNSSSVFNYKGWRENFIITILRFACLLGIVMMIVSFPTSTTGTRILFIILYLLLLTITFLSAPYLLRAGTLITVVMLVGINALIAWGPWLDGSLFLFAAVILAALLFDNRTDLVVLGISTLTIILLTLLGYYNVFQPSADGVPATTLADWLIYAASFIIFSIVLTTAINLLKKEFASVIQQTQSTFQTLTSERAKLEERVQERTEELETRANQLRASTSIARTMAEIQNVSDLLNTVVTATSEQFGYYHVGIYLLDERKKNAFLQASSSASGKLLIGQGHRIEPDRRNAINIVVEQNRAYMATDISGSVFIKEPDFPITRSRMVLPLPVRGIPIGVLDMHSDQIQSFSSQDVEILQTLADLIAISIDNVRLLNESNALLEQINISTSAQTGEIWSKHVSRQTPAYQYTPAGVRPLFAQSKPEDIDEGSLYIPLVLHGQNIGKIKLVRKGVSIKWSDKEKNLVEKIADQISLALENSRLVDEAQKNAHRDQLIANISSRVRETLDVESVIRTAAAELRKVFDLKEAEISLGSPQAKPTIIRKNTSSLRLKE